jgi:putative flippase GtrA
VSPVAVRWFKFNLVGAIGFGVQMAAFGVFYGGGHMNKLWATGLAVETAVLHNFVWHERFTWRHLASGSGDVLGRLLRFHAGNGLVSIIGNIVIVKLFVDFLRVNPYLGNVLAIAICAGANFAVSERFVFRRP